MRRVSGNTSWSVHVPETFNTTSFEPMYLIQVSIFVNEHSINEFISIYDNYERTNIIELLTTGEQARSLIVIG